MNRIRSSLPKIEHEASLGLSPFYFFKCLIHLSEFARFRNHLRFARRVKLKCLSQIDSIPQSRANDFGIVSHDSEYR